MLPELGCTRALLLQGPAGPFMRRFATELEAAGIHALKVNLHPGDELFFRGEAAVAYRGSLAGWRDWVGRLMADERVDAVFLFGDCRPYHRVAIEEARSRSIRVWVFEEGYLRPDFITLEPEGVNGNSRLPRDPGFYTARKDEGLDPPATTPVGPSFGISAWYSALNALAFTVFRSRFPHYQHHRPLNAFAHAFWWSRGAARKLVYSWTERHELTELVERHDGRYFLVPLQVHCDYQLAHSPYSDVREFIREVMEVFAQHGKRDELLVFKHHPMDRPFRDYGRYLRELGDDLGVGERIRYVHDLHLPTLLQHARGTITINSTVGLSSAHHGTPVFVAGDAIYDLPGLGFVGELGEFFEAPGEVDQELYAAFRRFLERHNQANGNFYRRVPGLHRGTGVRWFREPPEYAYRGGGARTGPRDLG